MAEPAARRTRRGPGRGAAALAVVALAAGCARGGDSLERMRADLELDGWTLAGREGDSALVMTRGLDTLDVRAAARERREGRARWSLRGPGTWNGTTIAPEPTVAGRPDASGAVVESRGGLARRPEWLPLYPGADTVAARGASGPGGTSGGWHFETPDSLAAVTAFHVRALEAAGLAVRRAGVPAGSEQVNLAAADAGRSRLVHVLLTPRASGGTGGDVQFVQR